jgi:hypothetical protein
MNASITITGHAAERIAGGLGPLLGDAATETVDEIVLDAVWNHRFCVRAPRWIRTRVLVRGEGRLCSAATAPAPVPSPAGGRVIGLSRTRPAPVAFQHGAG